MDTIPAVFLVIGAAFAWLGVTLVVILRTRHRRSGSRPVHPPHPTDQAHHRAGIRWRRLRRIADQNTGTPSRRRGLRVRKVRH